MAIAPGMLIWGFNLYTGTESVASVLQIVTSKNMVLPLLTTPEFCVKTFISIFCEAALTDVKTTANTKAINLDNLILLFNSVRKLYSANTIAGL